jgi:hypothetical protein
MTWAYGDVIVHREIAWGRPWLGLPEVVVEDTDDLLMTYIAPAAPFGFTPGPWPTANGLHPWQPNREWKGNGVLVVQRPGDAYAVWHFWTGDERRFEAWYINLQEPLRRTSIGYDTQDHELDLIVLPDGQWLFKDDEKMEQRIAEGRYTAEEVVEIRALGARIGAMLDAGDAWWEPALTTWSPDPSWSTPALPSGWVDVEAS